ncbi:MAG: 4'-phosphopantetheinyl transferase superfamily protein [Bacteroidota bacterium]
MPILEIRKLSSSRSIALWKIAEDIDALFMQCMPNTEDLHILKSYKSKIKQKEWLAGRLTIQTLLESLNQNYQGIRKNRDGKPVLALRNGEISITHSYPYVAVMYDRHEDVGIDLERPTSKLKLIAKKFLSDSELEFAENDLIRLCICWCAKEALYKIYSKKGLIFRENLIINEFEPKTEGVISGSIIANNTEKKYNLQYNVEQDYVLVYNV